MTIRYRLAAEDIPDEMLAAITVSTTVASSVFDEFLDLLIARQLYWRLPPQELLKELDPLEDPLRPLVD